MPLSSGRSRLAASVSWVLAKTNTGFNDTEQKGSASFSSAPSASTYNHVFTAQYSIAASGTQAVDFRGAWTNTAGESVTGAKILGFFIKVTGSTGVLKVEPHSSNGLTWPFATGSAVSLTPSTTGACWLHCDGTHGTVDGTHKQWLLTNTGSATITVTLVAWIGT